jgi:Zn-dependent protease
MSQKLLEIILIAPPLLLALTCHEFAHGFIAFRLGDPTAAKQGRLTLNPLKHLDPLGTLAFFFIHFGWAKPVPVDARYFADPRKGMLWVALAGPGINIILALASAFAAKALLLLMGPLPNSAITSSVLLPVGSMLVASVWINLVLAILNLIPVPPLDGSRILAGILPVQMAHSFLKLEKYGMVLLLILVVTGILEKIIGPVIQLANGLLLG